jgi:hypothetical protein
MYAVVLHHISDPDAFWSGVREATPNIPEPFRIHHCLPNQEGTEAVCEWEGESLDAVREMVDGAVGAFSRNEFFAAEAREGVKLPSAVAV